MTIRGQAAPVGFLGYVGRTMASVIALGTTCAFGYVGFLMATGQIVF